MVIYVGNLAATTSEYDLLEKFEQYGRVTSANIIKDEVSSRGLGFGFIEMPETSAAYKAIDAVNRTRILDSVVLVCETAPRVERRRFVANKQSSLV
ncbi:MAG: RNA-binding protein [Planctomycetota bacterium]|nr:RNA-binding protein [Planctomycetota bacterium]